MARLFAQVFEHANFGGQSRFLRSDTVSFPNQLGFNDKISSIIIYKGNDYRKGDVIRFYANTHFVGGYLELGPGRYANIHVAPFSFGGKISSADFHPYQPLAPGLGVRLMVRVYEHVNFNGQFRDLLLSEPNFNRIGFSDKVSSVRIWQGEDYRQGDVANFYQHVNYSGALLQPANFGPGTSIPNIAVAPYSFNDSVRSMRVSRVT
ncbi:Beta/Gamma crystallin [Enhygromyxa salina]|uniref:Beta/Gamma crystallin n=1 Tax=Enhygromyxa salina TaxID=215803 RepID=A0A2S9XY03_9BACT|nr:hypothetical protein [Enhygromyxa salina]PRP97620.1 Beta/Gamma crystallin [Enhygromyxa salina]